MQRRQLPIYEHRDAILYAVETHGVTVIVGETGSGKSSQIPQYLHEAGWTRDGQVVACTQPRRVAAISVATRVAEEVGVALGREVGYEIRFDACTHPTHTRIKYLTDGMLLRQLMVDPLLSQYSVIMLDEAHERGLNSDVLLGLLKRVRRARPDLRLVVASATLEADKFARFFDTRGEGAPGELVAPPLETEDGAGGDADLPDAEEAILRGGEEGGEGGVRPPSPGPALPPPPGVPTLHTDTVRVRKSRWGDKPPAPACAVPGPSLAGEAMPGGAGAGGSIADPVRPDLSRACVIAVQGRCFPVEVVYAEEPVKDYVASAAEAVLSIHAHEGSGDVLVFLPGAEHIDACCELIRQGVGGGGERGDTKRARGSTGRLGHSDEGDGEDVVPLDVFPLHANLTSDAQLAALEPGRVDHRGAAIRKVVIATNIAETSLTIEGVVYVVDSGWVKLPFCDPDTGISALLTVPVSQAGAAQRSGRAGRVQRGTCLRLYTEETFRALPARTPPEILRAELDRLLLTTASLGVTNPARFDWLDPPRPASVILALDHLYALRALDSGGSLTPAWGGALADLPVHPRLGAALLAAASMGCAEPMLSIVAMTEVSHSLAAHASSRRGAAATQYETSMQAFVAREGDHVTLLNVYTAYASGGRATGGKDTLSPSQWAASHGFSGSALAKAAEIRGQLRKALVALCTRAGDARRTAGLPLNGVDDDTYPGLTDVAKLLGHPYPSWSVDGSLDPGSDSKAESLRKALAAGLFVNAAKLGSDGLYVVLCNGNRASLAPNSVYARNGLPPPEWIVFDEADWSDGQLSLRLVTSISPLWLLDVAPHAFVTPGLELDSRQGAYLQEVRVSGSGVRPHAAPPTTGVGGGGLGGAPPRVVYRSAADRKREAQEEEEAEKARAAGAKRSAAALAPPPSAPSGGSLYAQPGMGMGVASMLGALFEEEERNSAGQAVAAAAAQRSALGRTGGLGRGGVGGGGGAHAAAGRVPPGTHGAGLGGQRTGPAGRGGLGARGGAAGRGGQAQGRGFGFSAPDDEDGSLY